MRLFSMCLFVGIVSFFVAGTDTASAQKGAKKTADQILVTNLEAIRTTLNNANHDYDGHRASAVHHVTHAIHIIKHAKPHPNPGEHFKAARPEIVEPQAASDAQLKTAQTALQNLTVPATKHQAKVQEHITKAVTELQTALMIK
jgi:hypothetical protein